jgi:hypothetical protein
MAARRLEAGYIEDKLAEWHGPLRDLFSASGGFSGFVETHRESLPGLTRQSMMNFNE